MRGGWLWAVGVWWLGLATIAAARGPALGASWPAWPWAFAAGAAWGLNLLLVRYGLEPPLRFSRAPVLATGFAFFMTLFGSGSYWATTLLYPAYRVGIERAAWFVAVCTTVSLVAVVVLRRVPGLFARGPVRAQLVWDWNRLEAVTYVVLALSLIGTVITIRRIGYVPLLAGDPTAARVGFPSIGGVWYRLSMLGGLVGLLAAVQAVARRATVGTYAAGAAGLAMVGLYGPRFFVALPVGVALLLWDQVRAEISVRRVAVAMAILAPMFAIMGYLRTQDQSVSLLGPLGLLFYGTLGEFRDLGWALDYYGFGDRFLHGGTLGSLVVPLLPSPIWSALGIDKAAIYAQSSASFLADAMGQTTGQRIGAYGEFFMNFGWTGALAGAALYGALLAYLDDRFRRVDPQAVRGILLALVIAAAVFAQVGQLNMFTSTITGTGYPVLLVALVAARREPALVPG